MALNFSACANSANDTAAEAARAAEGIVNPVKAVLSAKSCILRFGSSFQSAVHGNWWYSLAQHENIESFAILNKLAYPYAARMLTATLHLYSDMTHLVRVETTQDLVYYHGASKRQERFVPFSDPKSPTAYEMMAGVQQAANMPFVQYYIPGIRDRQVNDKALGPHKPMRIFAPLESHMFGMHGVPAGAIRH